MLGLKIPQKNFRNKNMFTNLFWPKQPCARWPPTGKLIKCLELKPNIKSQQYIGEFFLCDFNIYSF